MVALLRRQSQARHMGPIAYLMQAEGHGMEDVQAVILSIHAFGKAKTTILRKERSGKLS